MLGGRRGLLTGGKVLKSPITRATVDDGNGMTSGQEDTKIQPYALQWEVIQRAKCRAHCQLQDLQGLFHEYELKRLLQLYPIMRYHKSSSAQGIWYGVRSPIRKDTYGIW